MRIYINHRSAKRQLIKPDEIAYFLPSYVEESFLMLDNVQLMELTKAIAQNF